MDEKQFAILNSKFDILIKLTAVQALGEKKGKDAIQLLHNFGFQPKEIAEILGTTRNSVSVTLNKLNKGKGKGNA